MQGSEIANRLKQVIPKYTNEFSVIKQVSSLTVDNGTITATIASHGRSTGDYIAIQGAGEPITISNITIENNIATLVCAQDHKQHKLGLGEQRYITLNNCNPVEYNGKYKLISVLNKTTLTFEINKSPTSFLSGNLLYNSPAYNGYKQITVIDNDNITYSTTDTNLQSPAQGTITATINVNIGNASSLEEAVLHYSKELNSNNLLKYLYIIIEDASNYNSDNISSTDPAGIRLNPTGLFQKEVQLFSIYCVIPKINQELSGDASDFARRLIYPIYKTVLGWRPNKYNQGSNTTTYYAINGVGNNTVSIDEFKSLYVHQYQFTCRYDLSSNELSEPDNIVPLQNIAGSFGEMPFDADLRK